ncbi:protein FAR1-RELATED SEQUENCE 5-like [Quillaja saponaria]|uniref:Protein FAR1-RELATED SEQUENCE 5-like n=1 Tax=Quillaja saponaria TaxID=32244 RepID=A0AAD7L304_QUISA|nr:protein FAR1-RELATED SEQUENCE 5-like [Quillaja saponaria]
MMNMQEVKGSSCVLISAVVQWLMTESFPVGFLCNKQGFYVKGRNGTGPVLKQRSSAREGCKAMLMVKVNKSGKWVVTKFVKDHTHSLGVSARPSSDSVDSKDKKIQELGMELERQDRLCQLYRELLCSILDNVEDQTEKLATKVVAAVNSVREIENEAGKPSDTR